MSVNCYIKTFDELTNSELYEIIKARETVFLLEQGIICQDLDDEDYKATHVFITNSTNNGEIDAYCRILVTDKGIKVGRVLTTKRGCGIGRILIEQTVEYIKEIYPNTEIYVNAQVRSSGFYRTMGFCKMSEEYLEEDVPHILMVFKDLS